MLAATGLTIYGIVAAIRLIVFQPGTGTIIIGAGIVSFGVLILIFLVKFAFSPQQVERDHLVYAYFTGLELRRGPESQLTGYYTDL